jgi:hypothetical protein
MKVRYFEGKIRELLLEESEVLEFIRNMQPHDHVILFYETPREKYRALFTYVASGIEKGMTAAYVAGEEPPEIIRKRMREYGIDIDKFEKEGALKVINYDGWYIKNGKADPDYTIELWKRLFEEAKEKGFKGFRATGEMTCFFKHGLVKDLIWYEQKLHRRLELAIMGLCAYNVRVIKALGYFDVILDLIRTHKYVIILGSGEGVAITYY